MKEVRFFYAPDAETLNELPQDEAMHAMRVLRLKSGDEMMLMDGKGLLRAEGEAATATTMGGTSALGDGSYEDD